jgi:MOSC domain-containing protein YiiM
MVFPFDGRGNVSNVAHVNAEPQVKYLYFSPGHNFYGHHERAPGAHPMVECAELRLRAGRGIEGDRFFDYKPDYKGQVTFFSHEVYERLCAQFGVWDKPPSAFRRNIIVCGADLPALIGCEFTVQGVRFLGTEESAPCYWMNQAFADGAEAALAGHGGLRARVLTDGVLRAP